MIHKSGTNSEDVQEMNRALVIDLLRQTRPISRAGLASRTGLQKATITNIVSDLIEWGLVRETGKLTGEKGRRAVGIELDGRYYKALSIRLARRYFYVMLVDFAGNAEERLREEIRPDEPPREVLGRIKKQVEGFLARQQSEKFRIMGIGMAVPGPVLFKKGRIAYNLVEFPGWEEISLSAEMDSAFGIPFYYDHDANTGALAEWTYGKFRRQKGTIVYIAAGDGIGAGVVINGRIQHGAQGFFGEIGHTTIRFDGEKCGCGNRGCLDRYASGHYLTRDVLHELPAHPNSLLSREEKVNVGSIIAAMRSGDAFATEKVLRAAYYLGIGMVNVINCYAPDTIIIGDELSLVGEALLNTVREVVHDRVLPEICRDVQIELTSFKDDAVLLGAAAVAINKIIAHPSAHFTPLPKAALPGPMAPL